MYIRIFGMDTSQKTRKNRTIIIEQTNDLENIPKKTKRCPKGTRRNRKTGGCDQIIPPSGAADPVIVMESRNEEPTENTIVDDMKDDTEIQNVYDEDKSESNQEKSLKLAPSQKNNEKLIINDVLAALPKNSNNYKLQKEKIEFDTRKQHTEYPYLYPDLDDPEFALKLAGHKEFNDTQYDGSLHNVKEFGDKMCNAEFELLPHQIFVKNFLSLQTPYNSLLLYHGLGSGKTCSAIGIAEEMRNYMKQIGIKQRIIVVAAPNVQANFKLQLFDERRLMEVDGVWNISSCIGNALIKEVNPTSLKGIPKELCDCTNSLNYQSILCIHGLRGIGEFHP